MKLCLFEVCVDDGWWMTSDWYNALYSLCLHNDGSRAPITNSTLSTEPPESKRSSGKKCCGANEASSHIISAQPTIFSETAHIITHNITLKTDPRQTTSVTNPSNRPNQNTTDANLSPVGAIYYIMFVKIKCCFCCSSCCVDVFYDWSTIITRDENTVRALMFWHLGVIECLKRGGYRIDTMRILLMIRRY